jgi:hypothetical protein
VREAGSSNLLSPTKNKGQFYNNLTQKMSLFKYSAHGRLISFLTLCILAIILILCHHAGGEDNPDIHFGKIKGYASPFATKTEEIVNITVVMNKYNDSLRSLRVPQYKIDSNIAPIVFHSDSLGYIDEDSIPSGRYELTFDGRVGPITPRRREGDHLVVSIIDEGRLLTLKLYDFCITADSISTINVKMYSAPREDRYRWPMKDRERIYTDSIKR